EVIVTEIPAKIGTRLGGAEQDRPDPQERERPAENPGAHGGGREHDRPALPGAIAHHMRPVEQPRPPGHEEWLRDERHDREQPDLRGAREVQLLGEHQHQLRGEDEIARAEDAHPQHVLAVRGILPEDLHQHAQAEGVAARTVRMPPHSTRAATMESTVITSPAAACEAKATQPTNSANVPWSATISRTRARPCATLAHTKESTLEKAGAPDTSATARLTT